MNTDFTPEFLKRDYPQPLLMPAAIAYFDYLLSEYENPRVLEFGSGGSTAWLASRCELVSVEHNEKWHDAVIEKLTDMELLDNVELRLVQRNHIAAQANDFEDEYFDFVFVDCYEKYRHWATANSIPKLKVGGWMIIDDSYRRNAAYAKSHHLDGWDKVVISGKKMHIKNYRKTETVFARKEKRCNS